MACAKLSKDKVQVEHLEKLGKSIEALRGAGATLWLSQPSGLLAEAYGKAGQPKKGLAIVDRTFDGIKKQDEMFFSAELYRIKSGCFTMDGATSMKVQDIKDMAIQTAVNQKAKLFADRMENVP